MESRKMGRFIVLPVAVVVLACGVELAACGTRPVPTPGGTEQTASVRQALTPTASVQLKVETPQCMAKMVKDAFRVTNEGTTPVRLSDISIKFWVDDTGSKPLNVHLEEGGGCVADASRTCGSDAAGECGGGDCLQHVSGTKVTATPLATACGPDPTHQANLEVAITNTDQRMLQPGQAWTNLRVAVQDSAGFSPRTADWYSQCVDPYHFVADTHFAVYLVGNLVRTSPGVPPSCQAPQGSQPLANNVIPDVGSIFALVGPLPGTTPVVLTISLPFPHDADVQTFIDQVSDPASPTYRQYLTPDAFAAQFGPSQPDYDGVKSFATTNNLTVTSTFTARDAIVVTGTAADVESAFFVTLNVYRRPDGSTFYAPADNPSANLTVPLLHVTGLDSFAVPIGAGGTLRSGTCPGTNSFYGPEFRSTYANGTDPNEGQGQTIAIFAPDTYNPANIRSYAGANGGTFGSPITTHAGSLSSLLDANVKQVVVPCTGSCTTNSFSTSEFTPGGGEADVELAMEMALAMAPQANLVVYEQNAGANPFNYLAILQAMSENVPSTTHPPQIIANSWVWFSGGTVADPGVINVMKKYAVQGQTFMQASGDLGAYNQGSGLANVPDPIIDSTLMTVVGGTQFGTSVLGNVSPESTWNDASERSSACTPFATLPNPPLGPTNCYSAGGGGFCNAYSAAGAQRPALGRPNFQSTLSGISGNTQNARMIPDVSIVANELATVTATNNATAPAAGTCSHGTSAAVALWAGFVALANDANTNFTGPIGFANLQIYAHGGDPTYFADVADGSDNNFSCPNNASLCSGASYAANTGYDLATGWGSPHPQLLPQLPPQACMTGSSLSAVIQGPQQTVTAFVPLGSYSENHAGVAKVPVEVKTGTGQPGAPKLITTGGTDATVLNNVINTCAGDSALSPPQVVCTSNGTNAYVITPGSATDTVVTVPITAASGIEQFSGGTCSTCNVTIDPTQHIAYMSIATNNDPGSFGVGAAFQSLNLQNANALGPVVLTNQAATTEDIMVDPIRHLLISPNEGFFENSGTGNFQLINTQSSQVFDFQFVGGSSEAFDSAAEDCETGIAVGTDEDFAGMFLVDLTQIAMTPGTGGANGTWMPGPTATQVFPMPEFSGRKSTVAIASGAHVGVLASEFGGATFVAMQFPAASGAAIGAPALVDYVVASIPTTPDGNGWQMGADPHTATAYISPNSGKPYAIFEDDIDIVANGDGKRTCLAVVDINALLARPRGSAGATPDNHQLQTELTPAADTCTTVDATGTNPPGCIVRFVCGLDTL